MIFDEPTTGLHFADIAQLMRAFGKLVERVYSLLIIEPNLDVIGAAHWLIEMGPKGEMQVDESLPKTPRRFSGRQAWAYWRRAGLIFTCGRFRARFSRQRERLQHCRTRSIEVRGAREQTQEHQREHRMEHDRGHRGIRLGQIPTGFDIIFGEGQRRYMESLNAYCAQFVAAASRAEADSVSGIPPTIAIESAPDGAVARARWPH